MTVAIYLAGSVATPARAQERVTVAGGLVEGITSADGIRSYRGIPFAAPPVGERRWRPPQPVGHWDGVRDTKAFGPVPFQSASGVGLNQSEDCLYLNVWTPAKNAAEKLPVMVWIYGGAFVSGATSFPLYDGAKLAKKGVIVVSVAYRVGVFGFLAHPELSREGGGLSGNYGLLDQMAGLRWVRENIGAFGGDPGRVTVFGESAGGISVSMLAASPRAKGLFQRAISQSGGSFAPPRFGNEGGVKVRTLPVAEKDGAAYLTALGATDIAAARALPAKDLFQAPGEWWPVFDGQILPGDQYDLYRAGRFNDTPILVGTNSDEGAMFVRPGITPDGFALVARAGFDRYADSILAAYPHATAGESFQSLKNIFRDSFLAWHTWTWAKLQSEKGRGKAFVYYLDRRSPASPDGSNHAADLGYVFGTLDLFGTTAPEETALSETIQRYWVNFARTGDPNGDGLLSWPAFTTASQQVMYFDGTPHVGPTPNLTQLDALDAYFAWRRDEAKKRK